MSGFDCEDHYLEHCYLVQIPKTVNGTVMIFEVFGERVPATVAVLEPEVVLRAEIQICWMGVLGEMTNLLGGSAKTT